MNLADAMERARVLDYGLQQQLRPYMECLKPRQSIYFPDFIAANQEERADNVLTGTKQELLDKIRSDIRNFKNSSGVEKVGKSSSTTLLLAVIFLCLQIVISK